MDKSERSTVVAEIKSKMEKLLPYEAYLKNPCKNSDYFFKNPVPVMAGTKFSYRPEPGESPESYKADCDNEIVGIMRACRRFAVLFKRRIPATGRNTEFDSTDRMELPGVPLDLLKLVNQQI